MTPTTKAGKECNSSLCKNGRVLINLEGYSVECSNCQGLGWLPAPGDALTWPQAETLRLAGVAVEGFDSGWRIWDGLLGFSEFRLALSQERLSPLPCFKCGGGLMRPQGMHVGLICDNCGAQKDFVEPAAMESVEEMCGKYLERRWLFGHPHAKSCYIDGFNAALSLTPTQLEALRKERSA